MLNYMTTTGTTTAELLAAKGLAAEMKKELVENILPYWMRKMCNDEGGFYGRITGEEVLEPTAPVGGIMTARIKQDGSPFRSSTASAKGTSSHTSSTSHQR